MDLALNNLQQLICHKTKETKSYLSLSPSVSVSVSVSLSVSLSLSLSLYIYIYIYIYIYVSVCVGVYNPVNQIHYNESYIKSLHLKYSGLYKER